MNPPLHPMPSRPSIPSRPCPSARLQSSAKELAWRKVRGLYDNLLRRLALVGRLVAPEAGEVVYGPSVSSAISCAESRVTRLLQDIG